MGFAGRGNGRDGVGPNSWVVDGLRGSTLCSHYFRDIIILILFLCVRSTKVKTGSGFNSLAAKYNGQAYGPLSSDPKKVTTEEEEEDIAPMFASTWGYYR